MLTIVGIVGAKWDDLNIGLDMSSDQRGGGGGGRGGEGGGDAGVGPLKYCHECRNEFRENVDECPGEC